MLFSTVYSHHVLRSAECCFKAILDYCREVGICIGGRTLNKVIDFLWLSEDDLPNEIKTTKDPNLKKLIQRLAERRLLKRALLLSSTTVKAPDSLSHLALLSLDQKRALTKKIWYQAGMSCLPQEIWLDAPPFPSFSTYDDVSVILYNGKSIPFKDIFPIQT